MSAGSSGAFRESYEITLLQRAQGGRRHEAHNEDRLHYGDSILVSRSAPHNMLSQESATVLDFGGP